MGWSSTKQRPKSPRSPTSAIHAAADSFQPFDNNGAGAPVRESELRSAAQVAAEKPPPTTYDTPPTWASGVDLGGQLSRLHDDAGLP